MGHISLYTWFLIILHLPEDYRVAKCGKNLLYRDHNNIFLSKASGWAKKEKEEKKSPTLVYVKDFHCQTISQILK